MSRASRAVAVLTLLAVLVSACAQTSRRVSQPELLAAEPFGSPLTAAEGGSRVYVPLVYAVNNKLGMAGCPPTCDEFGCTWCYDWTLNPAIAQNREAVPMLWDEHDLLAKAGGNSAWLMGWNEPDICPSQACISPTEGAILWRIVELRNPTRKLLAPVPSHKRPEWLVEWREAYREMWGAWPRIDGLAAHCYLQSAQACIELVQRYEGWATAWQVGEVWVTEFAFLPAYSDARTEARAFVDYLESAPLVTRYAPYVSYNGDPDDCPYPWWGDCRPEANPSLLEADRRTLTPLGELYAKPPDSVWWGHGW